MGRDEDKVWTAFEPLIPDMSKIAQNRAFCRHSGRIAFEQMACAIGLETVAIGSPNQPQSHRNSQLIRREDAIAAWRHPNDPGLSLRWRPECFPARLATDAPNRWPVWAASLRKHLQFLRARHLRWLPARLRTRNHFAAPRFLQANVEPRSDRAELPGPKKLSIAVASCA